MDTSLLGPDERLSGGALNAALANELGKLIADFTGRGATRSRAFIDQDLVVCLFEDWVWRPREPMEQSQGLLQRLVSLLRGHDQPPEPDPDRPLELARAAERYSVPLVTLREAVRVGLLAELGVSRSVIDEVRDWVAAA